MDSMTPAQERVYRFVEETITTRQTPPTRAEIAEELGFASHNAAQSHLQALARKGYIKLGPGSSRAIQLPAHKQMDQSPTESTDSGIPVIGRVAAGIPMLAVENIERRCRIDTDIFKRRPNYLLRVVGESMRDAGIRDGDLIGVAVVERLRSGDIGVFRRDDEVTVKRLIDDGAGPPQLKAENPAFTDIVLQPEREPITLEGEAVGVIRSL